jgi:hypothetical protein
MAALQYRFRGRRLCIDLIVLPFRRLAEQRPRRATC